VVKISMNERDDRLRDLFDPTHTLSSVEEALLRRKFAVTANTLTTATPPLSSESDVVVAEAAHLGVELGEHYLRNLGTTSLKAVEILVAVEDCVERDVNAVLGAVEQIKMLKPSARRHSDVVLAGMIAAEWAHLDVMRKNGKDYYTHPANVAAILESAWGKSRRTPEEDSRLQRLLFVAFAHDTFEDSLPKKHESFLSSDLLVVSPLFVSTLFEKLGRDDGDAATESLLALTKMRQGDKKTPLSIYTPKLLQDPDASLIKLADTQHNHVLDPKGLTDVDLEAIIKNRQRGFDYADLRLSILTSLENGTPDDRWMGHIIAAMGPNSYHDVESSGMYIRPLHLLGRPEYSRHHSLAGFLAHGKE
jgi:hypothetical protein